MTHGSLFSGIGGFDLAAEWMGWENKFHCEWNEFGQKVLKYYFPNAESFTDITKTDFTKYADRIDVLTGGFPCQPYSQAGKRLGKEDDRHLWPEMLRAIREIKPNWVVGENVYGLVNWSGGLVFHEVQADLENQGYEVFPFLLPACGVNAPHQRYRIWFIAYSNNDGRQKQTRNLGQKDEKNERKRNDIFFNAIEYNGTKQATSDTDGSRLWGQGNGIGKSKFISENEQGNYWQNFPTVPPICDGNDGLSDRLDTITFSKWRNESIKAGGNAIVPQVVYQIFKAIQQYNDSSYRGNTI